MKKPILLLLSLALLLSMVSCGTGTPAESDTHKTTEPPADFGVPDTSEVPDTSKDTETSDESGTTENPEVTAYEPLVWGLSGNPNDYDAEVPATNILRKEVQDKFTQEVFEDTVTGLSLDYNLMLPDGYGGGDKYPLVFFMSDSSLVGKAVNAPVIQCRGAMVWAADAWQAEHPCIIAVPQFSTTVINDNDGAEEITDYVEVVYNLITTLVETLDVDSSRVYGMGQSMGCMVTMVLDAKYPDLYTACFFVDGQWSIDALEGLKDRKFIYFAAEGDQKASAGMAEVKAMLGDAGIPYSETTWNAQDDQSVLNAAAIDLLRDGNDKNFVSWQIGSVVGKPGQDGGMREHMASFDFAYRQTVLREWLFAQSK